MTETNIQGSFFSISSLELKSRISLPAPPPPRPIPLVSQPSGGCVRVGTAQTRRAGPDIPLGRRGWHQNTTPVFPFISKCRLGDQSKIRKLH